MKGLKFLVWFLLLQLFWSCSWVQYFLIVNESNQPIEISYTLTPPEKTFAIFDATTDAFELKSKGRLNWEKKLTLADADTTNEKVMITLPANAALIFGRLHNDKYTSYNQYFINGRSFNLAELTIKTAQKTTTILPETFDNYFKERNGNIVWVES